MLQRSTALAKIKKAKSEKLRKSTTTIESYCLLPVIWILSESQV